jgi:hypothetical protein
MKDKLTRRSFIQRTAAGSVALGWLGVYQAPGAFAAEAAKPALLGGTPAHTGGWAKWPQWREAWEPELLKVWRSGRWFRGSDPHVAEFERGYAQLLGAKRCLATASGTTALIVSLHVMDVDAGDEVIVSPYTFSASYNAILNHKALPVFADTDPATLTMNPESIESRITERTRAIMPVHIFGMPCDMDPINAIARKHKLAVVEDACQAWLAEYKGRKCGTLGDLGCFSFQESKHIPSGEGGAISSMSEELIDKCDSFHNCGRACGTNKGNGCFTRGSNFRMTQAQAVSAEGVPCGGVYHEQYFDGMLDEAIASRGFKRLWSAERLKAYRDSFQELKGNKQVCETTVAISQNMLLADRKAMDDIIEAMRKVQAHSAELAKA